MPREVARAPAELAELQRGFLALVTSGGAPEPRSRAARAASAWIDAAGPAAALERLAVYQRMYALRMTREVAREFPATRALLGPERFARVARAFVAARASRSFTLEGYAAELPAFLRRTRALASPRLRQDAVALARLERALAEVRVAPPAPAHAGPGLAHADGARLLALPCDAEAAYARFLAGSPVGQPRRRAGWLAVYRHRGAPRRLGVARRELPLLRALLRGATLERAVGLANAAGLRPGGIRAALTRWVASGLLRPPPHPGPVHAAGAGPAPV